jgi:hypothetical protein
MPFFIAIALALVLTWAARRVGLATGLVDRPAPDGHGPTAGLKIHTAPIPVLGGLGVVTAVLATLLLAGDGLPPLVVAGVALATAIGLADDARPLPASIRLLVLAAAGVLLAAGLPLGDLGPLARPGAAGCTARSAAAATPRSGRWRCCGCSTCRTAATACSTSPTGPGCRSRWWPRWPARSRRPAC